MLTTHSRTFWFWHALFPLALFAALLLWFEPSDLDLVLSDPFYRAGAGGWVYRESWWAKALLHRGGKLLIVAIATGLLGVLIGSFATSLLRPWRRAALYLLLTIGLGTGGIALAKVAINRHCPWDYQRYGGTVPYTPLFAPAPAAGKVGHCFPAGHASGGFSLLGSYFVYHRRCRRRAGAALVGGLLLGSLFGFGQLARGAHFVSHNIWTAAFCWLVALLLYVFAFRGRLWSEPAAPGADPVRS